MRVFDISNISVMQIFTKCHISNIFHNTGFHFNARIPITDDKFSVYLGYVLYPMNIHTQWIPVCESPVRMRMHVKPRTELWPIRPLSEYLGCDLGDPCNVFLWVSVAAATALSLVSDFSLSDSWDIWISVDLSDRSSRLLAASSSFPLSPEVSVTSSCSSATLDSL